MLCRSSKLFESGLSLQSGRFCHTTRPYFSFLYASNNFNFNDHWQESPSPTLLTSDWLLCLALPPDDPASMSWNVWRIIISGIKFCMSTHFNAFLTSWPRSWGWGRGSAPGPPLSGPATCWRLLNCILQTALSVITSHHSLSSYLKQSPVSHLVSELLEAGLSMVSTLTLLSSSLPPSLAPPPGLWPDIAWFKLTDSMHGEVNQLVSFWKIILFTDLSAISKNWLQLNYTLTAV